jgi:hypothetical protein
LIRIKAAGRGQGFDRTLITQFDRHSVAGSPTVEQGAT